uniref:Uncharacterized protein n=1 Tax=Rhizophora mucronata TaxID=61149 RepID=A0A2P2P903_RHIMU
MIFYSTALFSNNENKRSSYPKQEHHLSTPLTNQLKKL